MFQEQVIVLQSIDGFVERFAAAAVNVQGFEWLAEMDREDVTPAIRFVDGVSPAAQLSCRLYAMISNQRAMHELLGP